MFSETQVNYDVQELCSKYNLSKKDFIKIKEMVLKAPNVKICPDRVTVFFMDTGFSNLNEHSIKEVILELTRYHQFIRHGDVLVNSSFNNQQQRDGVYFFTKVNNTFNLVRHNNGLIPTCFKAIEEFPIDYWEDRTEVVVSGKRISYYFSYEDIPISENIEKRIQPITKESINFLLRHDSDLFDDDVPEYREKEMLLSQSIFRHKNKVYVISNQSIPGYITYDDVNYENEVPSRWGIIKALIWLLTLHQKAVVTANHPDRLKEIGTFEEMD
jgi:hypothetical protein